MMRHKLCWLPLYVALLSGCSHYVYSGTILGKDSSDKVRTVLAYWTKTERLLWFDEYSGGVRLLTECSTNTIDFEEKGNSIIWEVPVQGVCGTLLNARKIEELGEGTLLLMLYCNPDTSDEFVLPAQKSYLPARSRPYAFSISRQKVPDIQSGIPKPPKCRDVSKTMNKPK